MRTRVWQIRNHWLIKQLVPMLAVGKMKSLIMEDQPLLHHHVSRPRIKLLIWRFEIFYERLVFFVSLSTIQGQESP